MLSSSNLFAKLSLKAATVSVKAAFTKLKTKTQWNNTNSIYETQKEH